MSHVARDKDYYGNFAQYLVNDFRSGAINYPFVLELFKLYSEQSEDIKRIVDFAMRRHPSSHSRSFSQSTSPMKSSLALSHQNNGSQPDLGVSASEQSSQIGSGEQNHNEELPIIAAVTASSLADPTTTADENQQPQHANKLAKMSSFRKLKMKLLKKKKHSKSKGDVKEDTNSKATKTDKDKTTKKKKNKKKGLSCKEVASVQTTMGEESSPHCPSIEPISTLYLYYIYILCYLMLSAFVGSLFVMQRIMWTR